VKVVKQPYELKDEHGSLSLAQIKAFGDITHSFIQRQDFTGVFLPQFHKYNS
jgi:4-hydroxyphenylpyruvate dioxygenase